MSVGTRRNGSSRFGRPFERAVSRLRGYPAGGDFADSEDFAADEDFAGSGDYAGRGDRVDDYADSGDYADRGTQQLGRSAGRYTGRHASPRGKAARKRAGKVVPAAAVAATLAAGTAAAYAVTSGGKPQAAEMNASMTLQGARHGATAVTANVAADDAVRVATATAKPKASASPSTTRSAAAKPKASATASARAAGAASPAPAASRQATATTALTCNLGYSMLPQNVTAIVSFLVANGYSHNAAAGIAGNIYQESKGNPESAGMGGGGLIGWTPLPSGYVTGNVSADLQTQLKALLEYNEGWSSYLPALNSAATPSDAAYIYVKYFERAGIPAASTRESSAEHVSDACGL